MFNRNKPITFKSGPFQIRSLCTILRPLVAEEAMAERVANEMVAHHSPRATGFIAVVPTKHWGKGLSHWDSMMNVLIPFQAWGKRHPQWDVVNHHVPSLKGTHAFEPEKFKTLERTEKGLVRSANWFCSILLIPVRCEVIESHDLPPLGADEFDLDLSSILWLMTTHMPGFVRRRQHLEIACLGTPYGEAGEALVVGFRDGKRHVDVRNQSGLVGALRIVGIVPSA